MSRLRGVPGLVVGLVVLVLAIGIGVWLTSGSANTVAPGEPGEAQELQEEQQAREDQRAEEAQDLRDEELKRQEEAREERQELREEALEAEERRSGDGDGSSGRR